MLHHGELFNLEESGNSRRCIKHQSAGQMINAKPTSKWVVSIYDILQSCGSKHSGARERLRLPTADVHPTYLVTFQGWSHQDNRPHGRNHVIRRDVLRLERRGHANRQIAAWQRVPKDKTGNNCSQVPKNFPPLLVVWKSCDFFKDSAFRDFPASLLMRCQMSSHK